MKGLQSKFIVIAGHIIIGRVLFHKELAQRCGFDGRTVVGGGDYEIDTNKKTIHLSGESHDYGTATYWDIQDAIDAGNVGVCNRGRYLKGYTVTHSKN